MLLSQNNIVYTHLSRKQRFTCLICKESQNATSFFVGYRFGQFAGYACDACCKKLAPEPELVELDLPEILVSSEECYDEFSLGLNMDLAQKIASDTKASRYRYERAIGMCMRGLILYSRRSKLARELMMCISQIRLNLLQYWGNTDQEIDEILFWVLEKCIANEEITCRKNSAMMRNVYRVFETEEARGKLLELEWK